jgi:hypothetical protein
MMKRSKSTAHSIRAKSEPVRPSRLKPYGERATGLLAAGQANECIKGFKVLDGALSRLALRNGGPKLAPMPMGRLLRSVEVF